MSFRTDDRALAYALLSAALLVVVVALMGTVLHPAFTTVQDEAAAESPGPYESTIDTGRSWVASAWTLVPLFTLLLVVVIVVGRAAVERGGRV